MVHSADMIFVGGIFWIAYCIIKWCGDTVDDHFDDSIFRKWEYFRHDWTRKYINGDPDQGRKKIWFIPIPPLFFDGWHLFDFLRNAIVYSAIYYLVIKGDGRGHWDYKTYFIYGTVYATALMLSGKIFYEGFLIIPKLKQNKEGGSNE